MKKNLIIYELRVFQGDRFSESAYQFSVPFQLLGGKAGYGLKARASADPKAIAVAKKIWAYLRYPTPKNEKFAQEALADLGGIEPIRQGAEEAKEWPEAYGQLVRLTCPAIALPFRRMHEFLGQEGGAAETQPRWEKHEAADVLK